VCEVKARLTIHSGTSSQVGADHVAGMPDTWFATWRKASDSIVKQPGGFALNKARRRVLAA
jgi:hypothetical protein